MPKFSNLARIESVPLSGSDSADTLIYHKVLAAGGVPEAGGVR
jgi:hypothetical protein